MSEEIYNALRKQVFKLSKLSEGEWKDFCSRWRPLSVKKGEHIIKEGQIENHFYFVYKGVMRGYYLKDGDDISIGFSYDGDYSGSYDSFLARVPSDFYMQALTNAELLKISYNDLMEQFDLYKSVERWGRKFNAHILIGMARRQLEVRSFSAEERFERLMNQSPHIFQLVPLKHLASYLGMTAETLSRLRNKSR